MILMTSLNSATIGAEEPVAAGGLTAQQELMLIELWSERGLDPTDPTTYDKTKTENNRLKINHVGDPAVSVVSTRE